MSNITDRPNYIDMAKVLAIYAVILGHFAYYTGIPFSPNTGVTRVTHFVTLFHMPFFFIVTGVVSSFKATSLANFTKRHVKTLLVPYILFSLILGGAWTALNFFQTGDFRLFGKLLLGIVSGSDFRGCSVKWAGPMWFVYALFFIKLIIACGFTLKNKNLRVIYFGVLLASGCVILYSSRNPLPFRIDSILVGFIFVLIGFGGKRVILKIMDSKKLAIIAVCISASIIALFECFYIDSSISQGLSINANYYGTVPILFLLSGVSGTILILGLSRLFFVKRTIILTMSNGLLVYLAMHWVLYFGLSRFYCSSSVWVMFAMAFLVFVLCYPIVLFVTRFFPVLLGYRK